MLTETQKQKVIGHALDHVAYGWSPCLPVRHDRKQWTQEEIDLYNETYEEAEKKKNKE